MAHKKIKKYDNKEHALIKCRFEMH